MRGHHLMERAVRSRHLEGAVGSMSERGPTRARRSRGARSVLTWLTARARGSRSDRGSATVWVVCLIGAVCAVFGVVLVQGEAVLVRHRAAGAADLAALAAADHWMEGGEAACAMAGRVAGAQGSRLVRCAVVGDVSDVTAASGSGPFTAEVRARAGSPSAPEPQTRPTAPRAPGARSPSPAAPRATAP